MQDRFKFRAWDENNEIMHYDYQAIRSLSKNGWLIFQSDQRKLDWDNEKKFCVNVYPNPYFVERLKIMQCTGLKDKNGKLIYEGDIITIPDLYPFYDYKDEETPHKSLNETYGKIKGESILNYIGIVKWIFSQWQYVYHCVNPKKVGISEGINNELNENGYDDGENSEYLIIGNIYENPELLEVKNE